MFQDSEINEELVSMMSFTDLYGEYKDLIETKLAELVETQAISLEDQLITTELLNYFHSNEIESYDDAMIKIEGLITRWNSNQFELGTVDGEFSAAALSIAKHSFTFWNDNPEALKNIHNIESAPRFWWIVAQVAFRDVASGVAGTIGTAILEGVIHDGEAQPWTGKQFATTFIYSAVTGSIGL